MRKWNFLVKKSRKITLTSKCSFSQFVTFLSEEIRHKGWFFIKCGPFGVISCSVSLTPVHFRLKFKIYELVFLFSKFTEFNLKVSMNAFLCLHDTDLVKMSYYHLKSTFYLHDVTFRILSGGLVINMVAPLSIFFAKKGWEWMEWKYILIPWTPGPPHLILAHPHTHDIYTRLIFIIAKKAVVLQIKKKLNPFKNF